MLEYAQLVTVLQLAHELRVVNQLKLTSLGHGHASGRDGLASTLVDATGQGGKERLFHQEARSVHIQIERGRGVNGAGGSSGLVSHSRFPHSMYTLSHRMAQRSRAKL